MPLIYAPASPPEPPDPRISPGVVVEQLAPVLSSERRHRIERVLRRRLLSVTVVLERVHDPHNGAAVVRTCEALGLAHVHVVEATEPFRCSRKVTRNAHKWLGVYLHRSVDACLGFLEEAGFCCYAAVPPLRSAAGSAAGEVDVTRPVALVFGSEHLGLSAGARARCQGEFSIPMHGFSESLNLSVSVALALQQVTQRRRELIGRPGDLSPAALEQLRAAYYGASTRHAARVLLRYLGYPV